MYNKNAKELYDIVPYGTIVTIVHKNRPFKELKSGDVGSDVLKVQKALKNWDIFMTGPAVNFKTISKKA